MQLTSIIKNAANSTACTLCVCREAFDKWSPVPLIDIVLVVALLWSMDFLVKRWVRMSRASEGNIFMAKPEPGKKLPLNWDYIGTLDNNTKKNFHRLIAVTDDRLKFASYYKMKDYPVLLLFYSPKNKYFFTTKNELLSKTFSFWNLFRPLKKATPTKNVAFVTRLRLLKKWNRNNLSSSGQS